jgi:hypothetical protein
MDRSEFKKYLIDTKKLLDEYTGDYTLEDIMEIADKMGDTIDSYLDIKYNSLYEIEDPNEINDIISKLKAEPVFNHLDRYDRIYTNILKSYRNFLKNNNNMKFTEAKEFLNNKGYMLVESEFRDPSTYASFYYPPEGPDTEDNEERAEREATKELKYIEDKFQKALDEKFPKAYVTAQGPESNEDGDLYETRDEWSYTETFKCKLLFQVPIKYLNLTEEGAEDDDELDSALTKFYESISSLNDSEIEFDETDYTELDTSDNNYYGNICVEGTYKFSEGDSRY